MQRASVSANLHTNMVFVRSASSVRFYGVTVSTCDSESQDPSSNLGRTFPFLNLFQAILFFFSLQSPSFSPINVFFNYFTRIIPPGRLFTQCTLRYAFPFRYRCVHPRCGGAFFLSREKNDQSAYAIWRARRNKSGSTARSLWML